MATRLSYLIKKEFSTDINVGDIFDFPTIQELAKVINERSKCLSIQINADILRREVSTPVITSWSQERLWILEQLIIESSPYNIGHFFKLQGEFDFEVFKKSLKYMIHRHEILRTTFFLKNTKVYQEVHEEMELNIEEILINQDYESKRLKELVHDYYSRPFDLNQNCFRVTVIYVEELNSFYLLFAFHHIIFDGSSESVFFQELSQIYRKFKRNLYVELDPLPIQFADYSLWNRSQANESGLEVAKKYWEKQMGNIPVVHGLPLDFPRPEFPSYQGRYITRIIDRTRIEDFKRICNERRISLFMGLHGLFAQILARKSGQKDVCIGTPTAGRDTPQLDNIIGFFVNTLVLRTKLADEFTYDDLFQCVKETDIAAFSNQGVSFDYLVNKYAPNRNLSHSPLFQIMFILQNTAESEFTLESVDVESMPLWYDTAKFDLTLNCKEIDGELHMIWEYAEELFSSDSVEDLAESFEVLLEGCIKDTSQNIFEIPLCKQQDESESEKGDNQKSNKHPLICRVEENTKKFSMNTALIYADKQITFGEIEQLASKVALAMLQKGVQEGSLVVINLDPSIEQLISVIATLKLGAAFVPFDSEYLKMRAQETLKGINIDLTIGTALESKMPLIPNIAFEELNKILAGKGPNIAGYVPSVDNTAYVIFTSGTTGRPKGVQITQDALLNYLQWCEEKYTQIDFDMAVMHSPLSFDATITSSLFPLYIGKPLTIIPRENTLGGLEELIKTSELKLLLKITPAHLDALHSLGCTDHVRNSEHTFIIGGDALTNVTLEPWMKAFPKSLFFNEYGPTEATVGCCVKQICVDDLEDRNISIGKPINNIELYILENDRLLTGNATGELCIAGASLSKGYINSDEETQEKFVKIGSNEKRVYKTGDIVTKNPEGYTYIRRLVDEFKINGYRINTSEIDEVIRLDVRVENSIVLIDKEQSKLVGFVTGDKSLRFQVIQDELINKISEKFPKYMIPSAIYWEESFPLTSNGKVDKRALLNREAKPLLMIETNEKEDMLEPGEVVVYTIWKEILEIKNTPRDTDTFFSLGGSSMQATQVVGCLSSRYGIKIKIRDVFVHSKFRQFVDFLNNSFKTEVLLSRVHSETIEWTEEDVTI